MNGSEKRDPEDDAPTSGDRAERSEASVNQRRPVAAELPAETGDADAQPT